MLEIVVWGMAIMLIVKAFDIGHREAASLAAHGKGNGIVAGLGIMAAVFGAIFLVGMSNAHLDATAGDQGYAADDGSAMSAEQAAAEAEAAAQDALRAAGETEN